MSRRKGAYAIFEDAAALKSNIRKKYEQRLYKLKGKIRRSAVYSTISVFWGQCFVTLSD